MDEQEDIGFHRCDECRRIFRHAPYQIVVQERGDEVWTTGGKVLRPFYRKPVQVCKPCYNEAWGGWSD